MNFGRGSFNYTTHFSGIKIRRWYRTCDCIICSYDITRFHLNSIVVDVF